MARRLDPEDLDQTLDYFGELDHAAVVGLLDHVGIRYTREQRPSGTSASTGPPGTE